MIKIFQTSKISAIVLLAFITTNCSTSKSKAALRYSETFVEIVNDVRDDLDSLRSMVDSVDTYLTATHTIDTVLLNSCVRSVRFLESKLIEKESKVKEISPFNQNDSIKIKTLDFLKISRQEILPLYSQYFETYYEEYVTYPINQKDTDELIKTNQNIIKINEGMIRAISKEFRAAKTFYDFVLNWRARAA
jgi:hypothetical protein